MTGRDVDLSRRGFGGRHLEQLETRDQPAGLLGVSALGLLSVEVLPQAPAVTEVRVAQASDNHPGLALGLESHASKAELIAVSEMPFGGKTASEILVVLPASPIVEIVTVTKPMIPAVSSHPTTPEPKTTPSTAVTEPVNASSAATPGATPTGASTNMTTAGPGSSTPSGVVVPAGAFGSATAGTTQTVFTATSDSGVTADRAGRAETTSTPAGAPNSLTTTLPFFVYEPATQPPADPGAIPNGDQPANPANPDAPPAAQPGNPAGAPQPASVGPVAAPAEESGTGAAESVVEGVAAAVEEEWHNGRTGAVSTAVGVALVGGAYWSLRKRRLARSAENRTKPRLLEEVAPVG